MQSDSRTRKQYMEILTILSTREPSARQMTAPKPYKAAAELKDDKSSIRAKRKKKKKNSITIAISAHHKTEIQAQSSYCLQGCRVDNIRTDYNGSKHMRYKQNCCPLITTSDSIKPADQQTSVKTYSRKQKNSRGDNQRATSYYYHHQNSIVSVISTLQKPVQEAEAEN
jgi:hypothetical protein